MKRNFLGFYALLFYFNGNCQFLEQAFELGIDHTYKNDKLIGGGAAVFDVNNDGWQDIFIVGGENSDGLYINEQTGFERKFSYLTIEDIEYYDFRSIGVIAGDINNDGWDDLFVTTTDLWPNLVMINNRNNTFDVIPPEVSGILDTAWSVSASFGDFNKDGLLDIAVANYIDTQNIYIDQHTGEIVFAHVGYRNNYYLNQGNNSFIEVSDDVGIYKKGNSLAVSFTDFDNDNDVDIYVVNDFGAFGHPNELYENQFPNEVFTDISESSGMEIGIFGMGLAIGDYDNDLDLDYYVTNLGKNALMNNNGDKTFDNTTIFAGVADSAIGDGLAVGWGTGFVDYDNDGWLDLYISNGFIPAADQIYNPPLNPNALYRNNQNGSFTNVTRGSGIADDNAKCRGSAYGDFNNDGFQDIVIVPVDKIGDPLDTNTRSEVELFYNITENTNNWVKLDLEGTESNRNGFGSHVFLYDNQGKIQMREVDGGSSHASSNSSIVHFGLGTATGIDSICIIWSNGILQTIQNPEINQLHPILESNEVINSSVSNVKYHLDIFPNPAKEWLIIRFNIGNDSEGYSYEIVSLTGQFMKISDQFDGEIKIDLSTLSAGAYIVNIMNQNKVIISEEIIVKR